MRPLYHVGDSVIIYDIRLDGIVIAYPRGNFFINRIYDFTLLTLFNYDYLYEDIYQDQIRTTSDGQIYAYTGFINNTYVYIMQLSTGELLHPAEYYLIPFNIELITRSINEFRRIRKRKRDDTVSAIALGTKMPLDINRHIASLTLRPISRKVGGRKKKRKTRKTRK